MKLIGLKFQGVGPYKGEFSIDFAALTRSHMFLIDGETGAGKTTILDCITFALYGNISGNTEGRNGAGDKQRLRSRFLDGTAEKTYVDLIFEEGGHYYKVYRSPEYPRAKARSEGFTSEKSKANMMRIAGDYEAEFRLLIDEVPQNAENGREAERYYAFFDMPARAEAITSKVSEVSVEVTGLLGLNRSQFSKTIMLAQGQFAEFLRMRPEQRTELVKDLFCAQEYEDIQNQLNVMRQQYGRRVDEQRHDLAAAIRDNQANAGRIREALNAYRDIDGASSDLTAASDAAQPEAMPFGDDARWGLNEAGDIDEPAYSADQIVARLDGTLESVRSDAQTLVTKAETQFAEADSAWRESQRRNDTANAVRKAQGDLRSAQVRMEELNALEQENKRD
ncbi:MAG: SMC family ATPase, partial [Bifidobacterium merycicum]|nr:SMC family ATPase [Bifidobacterium merycicum]